MSLEGQIHYEKPPKGGVTKRQKGVRGLGADLRDDTGSEPVIGINQEEHFKRGQHEVGKGAWCG